MSDPRVDGAPVEQGTGEQELRRLLAGLTAVRDGDFGTRLPDGADGLLGEIATVFNGMVDQLSLFTSEVTRVAREVGTEGRLGGQADVKGVSGTWRDLTDSVNAMAGNLTTQVRDIAQVATAVAKGDLSQKIDVDARGEILELKNTVNTMVDQLSAFADEVTRVAREVGSEGRLGGQAEVPGVGGTWRDLTDSVNFMAGNLTAQVRDIAQVATAVARGDLSQKITVDARGEILELKDTVNTMVGQLSAFADEVTRVAREVGSEGRLGGQAQVPGVGGTWRDLTDSVNFMAGNLTAQVRSIAQVTTAVARGDLSQKIDVDARGEILELKDTVNTMVGQLSAFADEVTRVAREVGSEGRLGGQAEVPGVGGTWRDLTDSVNFMAGNLTAQVRSIAQVTTAVAQGDLSQKIDVDARGEILELKETVNTMVGQLSAFADEVTRVAREVGSEGRLGGQAEVPGVGGTWRDLTDSVNFMAGNLTAQVRSIAQVTTAVARGDLSQKIDVDARGEILELKDTVNTMVGQLSDFADEVTRVAREVGSEGRLGGQAEVPGVGGTWRDLTDSVNFMAGNLTAQVRSIAQVTTAVAQGDLSQKIDVDARGEILELKDTVNTMVGQLSAFADEVTRVAREVGSEGRLGGQAQVPGVGGTWRDLTDSVNFMAGNLTAQVRSIAQVTTAVAQGDLSQKITVDARGEILELKNTINTMVDQLSAFGDEVTRVAREVGTEGILGGQADVKGVSGTWRDLTDSVNFMAGNLTAQVRSIAQVATAVAKGDLSQNITVDARGEILELKNTINTMVDQLSAFADEVTRVAREVGTDGRLGGQARVPNVAGTWKALTESVNVMADNLTAQVRSIAQVTTAVAKGDLSQKIRVDARGEILELKETINTMVDQLSAFADEVTRVAREVGTEGNLGGQATVRGVSGTWKGLTDNVNVMASNLTGQVRSIAQVATAVARGDLSQKIIVEAKGEVAALAGVINVMVDTLSAFADEVTRVAREVGTDGRLGGQARVPNVAGTWKDLTDNVNSMANNLTSQVRNIAQVTTAVAQGDLTRKIDVDAAGEILELKTTINTMVDRLSSFASEVTRVAREVGTEGRLGGQAEVEGVSGTWKRLTENVNELAGNLTRQVRAIAEVTSAVAEGDLTRSISVDASGEVAELKDNINSMVESLRQSTQANQEQDWLKSNLARISGLMQGHRDLTVVAALVMDELVPQVGAQFGGFYLAEELAEETSGPGLRLIGSYGHPDPPGERRFVPGQSLVGQAARSRRVIAVDDLPPGYARITSGLGTTDPTALLVLPILVEDQVLGVIELASVHHFTQVHRAFLEQLMETIGANVNTIVANARTDALLLQSQRLTEELRARSQELQVRQDELQSSNAELEEKAVLLAVRNRDIETKNLEIEQARQELEARAQQLALASTYKSEFLANMSHELRTPLNSLLILAQLLAQNPTRNLTAKQVEYAGIIHSAGSDLLQLINDILDLSKVEAGKMDVSPERVAVRQLLDYAEATFRPLTTQKSLGFRVTTAPEVPSHLVTDDSRLRQVLRNLLSNAVKFTESGEVELVVEPADPTELPPAAARFGPIVAFRVRDTGIGIAEDQLESIFGAFQQADGTTSRKYGGTGLGLSISREIAHLLGGVITASSDTGRGSTFTLYLPVGGPEVDARPAEDARPGTALRRLLVVEQRTRGLLSLVAENAVIDVTGELGEHRPIELVTAVGVREAAAALAGGSFHCLALELDMPDDAAARLLRDMHGDAALRGVPVLAYNSRRLAPEQEAALRGNGNLPRVELLSSLDELRERIALHLSADDPGDVLPLVRPAGNGAVAAVDDRLAGRKVLVVDDDARNIFALTSILELHGMRVLQAENGRRGVEVLGEHPDIVLVLMDVMMPEMDGYTATASIRAMAEHAGLPIIAVTAKAMPGDREKSLASGANDYVTKPLDADDLMARVHRWLGDRGPHVP